MNNKPRVDIKPENAKTRDTLVAILAFAAGSIDALSFVLLGGVFASFMSGNTVTLGLRIGSGDLPLALNSLTAISGYIGGVAVGANIGYPSSSISEKIWPYAVTKILAVEFSLLVVFTIGGFVVGNLNHEVMYLFILLVSIPMGMQSVGVKDLGITGVTTTYVTGTWTSFIMGLVTLRRSQPSQRTIKKKQDTILQAITLLVYVIGATVGGLVASHLELKAAILPASAIVFVLIFAWIKFHEVTEYSNNIS
jgi:uncharacterized membrane protein YoaK (UPF0700 family)